MKHRIRRPIRRNPDLEAQRSWESDRSDRHALQRYLSSMARDREVLDDPERIVDLDTVVDENEELRPIYARVRPDYSDAGTSFEEKRWRTLVDRYAGRRLDRRAVLILVEMGLRSGVPISDVYRILYEMDIIDIVFYEYILLLQSSPNYRERSKAVEKLVLNIVAIPQIVYSLKNDKERHVRSSCAAELAYFGEAAKSYDSVAKAIVPHLIDSLKDQDPEVRSKCAFVLRVIGPAAKSAVPYLIDAFKNDQKPYVRESCRQAVISISGESPK